MTQLKGCNKPFSKEAILAINGFDMDYVRPAIGEDIDLTWRFEKIGYKLNWFDQSENIRIMQEKQGNNELFCINGISKIK